MQKESKINPLHRRHTASGANMADFGGYDMPLWYSTAKILSKILADPENIKKKPIFHKKDISMPHRPCQIRCVLRTAPP